MLVPVFGFSSQEVTVYEMSQQIVTLNEQVVVLQEQNVELQTTANTLNERLEPTFVDQFGTNDAWGAISYDLDVITTDFGANDDWGASPSVLYSGDYSGGSDNWGAVIA